MWHRLKICSRNQTVNLPLTVLVTGKTSVMQWKKYKRNWMQWSSQSSVFVTRQVLSHSVVLLLLAMLNVVLLYIMLLPVSYCILSETRTTVKISLMKLDRTRWGRCHGCIWSHFAQKCRTTTNMSKILNHFKNAFLENVSCDLTDVSLFQNKCF